MNKLRIDAVLGRGAMGIVYGATDLTLGRRVALKVIAPGQLDTEQNVRFEREARAAAALRSEHAVRIYETGRAPMPYLVMEYLEGKNLEHLLAEEGPLPVTSAITYVLEALDAIAEAHRAGFVHRDIKPANLFLDRSRPQPRVKVLDFGLVRTIDPTVKPLTVTGATMGTPCYMAPEQVDAKPVDARADVWSLGVTVYELLTGHTPFEGPTTHDVLARILRSPPVPLRQWRPDVPAELGGIIDRCLAKRPEDRYASGAELALALVAFERTSQRPAPPHVIFVAPPSPPPTSRPRRGGALFGVCAGLTVVVGLTAAWAARHTHVMAEVTYPAERPSARPQAASASASAASVLVPSPPVSSVASSPSSSVASSPSSSPASVGASWTRARRGHHVIARARSSPADEDRRFSQWIQAAQPSLDRCVTTKLPCYALSMSVTSGGPSRDIQDTARPDRAPKGCFTEQDTALGACLHDALFAAPAPCHDGTCPASVLLYVVD